MSDAADPSRSAAGGAMPAGLTGLAGAALAIPASLLLALPGLVYLAGFDHLAYGLGLMAGVVLAGLAVAPLMARSGVATVTEALQRRFGRATAVAAGIVIWLVVLPVLTAELAVLGLLAESAFGAPYVAAIIAAIAVGALAALATGERGFGWLAAAAYVLLAVSLLVPLALIACKAHGLVVPQLGYGNALPAIAALEEKLVENGLVDFDTFAAHATPFLRLAPLNLFALVVSLALGTAVFPPLLASLTGPNRVDRVRLAGAWTALFVMIVLISVPALAAYAKLEILGAIEKATPLAELPSWLEAPLGADLAHIHGTSLGMLEEVAKATSAGLADPTDIADSLAGRSIAMEQRWYALDDKTRSALIEAARTLTPAAPAGAAWQTYVGRVLPAAAAAAGNDAKILTQAALVIEPLGLLLALPGLSGGAAWVALLVAAGGLGAGLVMTTALVRSMRALAGSRGWRGPALALATGAAAAGLAALRPDELVTIVASSLSLGAAGLFPALVIGLAWKRATAAGAVAAMLVGGAVTLYYDFGIQAFPAAFYRTWPALSDAGDTAIEEFNAREEAWQDADGEEAKAAAAVALDDWARGTPTRSGLANWAGVDSAYGGVFGVPLALLALVLVSLVTRTRSERGASPPA